jgi:hypothetical protein
MKLDLCSNCICLPICISKDVVKLSKDCNLFPIGIVDSFKFCRGKGEMVTIRFTHLKRDIKLQIYSDTIYILDDDDNESAIMGINRNGKRNCYRS